MTYILVDAQKRATIIPANRIEAEATARMVRGEKFDIYRAEPMKLEINLAPAPASTRIGGPGRGRRAAPAATRRKAAGRAGAGRVGRPKVNVGPCTVPGCKRTAKTRGLCSAHYQQHRRLMRQGKPGLIKATAGATTRAAKVTKKKAAKKRTAKKKTTRKTARKAGGKRTRKATRKKARTTQAPPAPPSPSES